VLSRPWAWQLTRVHAAMFITGWRSRDALTGIGLWAVTVGSGSVSESDQIERTPHPATIDSISSDLRALGVQPGDVLIVHSSLRSFGWVVGGAAAVVDALLAAIGHDGTVTMPAHSGDWSDPSGWGNPPVPSTWWQVIVDRRPPFDPYATPLRGMGAVAENLLMRRQTLRSDHPLHSHMAHGRHATSIVEAHPLEDGFGDRSPLGRLYELDARVLLLGVGHEQNTSLHLAEARAEWPGKAKVEFASRVMTPDGPRQVTWFGTDAQADDFGVLGRFLEEHVDIAVGRVALAECRLASMRALIDAAVPWFTAHRR
jgi:aminoglycoside 3-N-acetyltransferase